MTKGALDGIKVLDLSRVLAAPWAAMVLSDLGAEVTKVESPDGDDVRQFGPPFDHGESAYFMVANRNKKSVTADLKTPEGQAKVRKLALESDVIVENFREGTLERYNLGYEDLRRENPGLILCSVSGYGRTGPMSHRPGYDFVLQAESGLMSIIGGEDQPPTKVGAAVTDIMAGQFAAQGILAALFHRERTGEGQAIDVSLLDSAVTLLGNVGAGYLMTGERPKRLGNDHPNVMPYRPFDTADQPIALGIGADRQFRKFAELIGRPELADDPKFARNRDRSVNREALSAILEPLLKSKPRDHWLKLLQDAGLPCGAIRTVDQVLEAPEIAAREMVVEVDHATIGRMRLVGSPIKMEKTPISIRSAPPLLGADDD